MSGIILQSAEILKPLQVAISKYRGDTVYPFERDFAMLMYTNRGEYLWEVLEGYVSNCGSIPWVGQKLLRVKSFDPKKPLQNAFFFFHDDLYQKKGYDLFDREDSDSLCRGGLREGGCSRFQASTIDFCLMIGAWGHWGDNSYGNLDFLSSLKKVG
jgi:hypothetical protein